MSGSTTIASQLQNSTTISPEHLANEDRLRLVIYIIDGYLTLLLVLIGSLFNVLSIFIFRRMNRGKFSLAQYYLVYNTTIFIIALKSFYNLLRNNHWKGVPNRDPQTKNKKMEEKPKNLPVICEKLLYWVLIVKFISATFEKKSPLSRDLQYHRLGLLAIPGNQSSWPTP